MAPVTRVLVADEPADAALVRWLAAADAIGAAVGVHMVLSGSAWWVGLASFWAAASVLVGAVLVVALLAGRVAAAPVPVRN